jgi:peptide/nickel transport system substrate-binding protein
MMERTTELRETLFKRRSVPLFDDFAEYIHSLRPGDRFIFAILGIFIMFSSLLSIKGLENAIFVVEPVYGGSLTEGDVGAPRFINPLLAISNADQDLTALTYAGLMGEGSDGSLVPVLAESYIVSPDAKTYQFTLRSNAKFSDGTPITADDVVYTVQKAQDPGLKSPQAANWNGVTVTAIDSKTVQFSLTTPYASFLYDTTLGILPAHLWRNVTDTEFPFSNLEIKPVGEGPFVPSNVTLDSNGQIIKYALAANSSYALGKPYLDSMNFLFYTDQPSLQAAITAHSVDSGYGVTGAKMITAPFARVFAVFFNPSQNILSKTATRQALSVAIDRTNIVKNLLGGYATALNGPVPAGSGVPGLTIPTSADRIANATQILTNAGWNFNSPSNIWQDKASNTLSVTLKTSDVPELKVLAEAIQTDWQMLHVATTIQYYEPGDLSQSVIRPRAFQALLFGMVVDRGDDLYDFWDSAASADPGLNVTSYSNPAVDKLLSQLRSDTDPTDRDQDLSQINQLISNDYPAAFVESPDFVYVVPNDLKGVILPQITSPSDRFATVATWYRRTESVWPFLARSK